MDVTGTFTRTTDARYILFKIHRDKWANIGDRFRVDLSYSDIVGEQATSTKLFVRLGPPEDDWIVRGIALYRGDEVPPFVRYGERFLIHE
jgi:hypothetical protein